MLNLVHPVTFWNEVATSKNVYSKICNGYTYDDFIKEQDSYILSPLVHLDKSDVILDLGCGLGRVARWTAPKIKQYIGVDVSEGMIEQAKIFNKDIPNAFFHVNDGKSLGEFSSDSINGVLCEAVFIHIPKESIISYVSEIHRVLKPGGQVMCWGPMEVSYENGLSHAEVIDLFKDFFIERFYITIGAASCFELIARKQ